MDERPEIMRDRYLSGETLAQIGLSYGISRERVRQIITGRYGSLASRGGKALSDRRKLEDRIRAKNEHYLRTEGCTYSQYRRLVRLAREMVAEGVSEHKTPIKAYASQRQRAKARGIAWEFTLWSWWTVWQKSGKWGRRGRGRASFVMCRKGDVGPYSPENVVIEPLFKNSFDGQDRGLTPLGVTRMQSGKYQAKSRIGGKVRRIGVFSTAEEAEVAYLKSLSTKV